MKLPPPSALSRAMLVLHNEAKERRARAAFAESAPGRIAELEEQATELEQVAFYLEWRALNR